MNLLQDVAQGFFNRWLLTADGVSYVLHGCMFGSGFLEASQGLVIYPPFTIGRIPENTATEDLANHGAHINPDAETIELLSLLSKGEALLRSNVPHANPVTKPAIHIKRRPSFIDTDLIDKLIEKSDSRVGNRTVESVVESDRPELYGELVQRPRKARAERHYDFGETQRPSDYDLSSHVGLTWIRDPQILNELKSIRNFNPRLDYEFWSIRRSEFDESFFEGVRSNLIWSSQLRFTKWLFSREITVKKNPALCLFPECSKPAKCRGLCARHYGIALRVLKFTKKDWKWLELRAKSIRLVRGPDSEEWESFKTVTEKVSAA